MSVLGVIKEELDNIGIPYEFMRWTSDVQYPYWVGEYSEIASVTEDGYKESTVTLTGTTNEAWVKLEQERAEIENHFPTVYGLRKATDKGTVVIYYDRSFPVPTSEADLKRIQIDLKVMEWRNDQ